MKKNHVFISYFIVLNLYVDLSLRGIDSFFLILVLPFLFSKNGNGKILISFMALVFLYTITCLFSGVPGEMKNELMSFLQFIIAMMVFFSLTNFLKFIDAQSFNKIVFNSFIIVSAISIAQFMKIDGGIIEHMRSIIHPDIYELSSELKRDESLTLSGTMRPLGLAKEPSYLSIFVVFCGYVILTLGTKTQKITYSCLFVFYLYANTSPVFGLLFVIIGLHYFMINQNGLLKALSLIFLIVMFYLCLVLLRWRFEISTGTSLSWNFLYEVYQRGLVTTESSLGIRIYNPFITMYNVLKDNLLFGAGFANLDYIAAHSDVAIFRPKNVLSNALASGFIYTGVMGMFLIFSIIIYHTRLSIKVLIPFLVILSFTGGGFFTIRFWGVVFLFVSVFILYKKGAENANSKEN